MKKMFLSDRLFNNNKLSEAIYTLYLKLIDEKHSAKVERTTNFIGHDEEDEWNDAYHIYGFNITFENGATVFVSDGSSINFAANEIIYHRSAKRIRSIASEIYHANNTIDNEMQEFILASNLLKHINGENHNG